VLRLSVQIDGDFHEVVVLTVERAVHPASVECRIAHQPDNQSRGKLTGNHFLVRRVSVILRNGERLANSLFYWVFSHAVL